MILESVVWISFLMNAAVNCLRRKNVVIHWYVFAKKNGGDERDTNNYFKRRMRELNEIAGIAGRGMDEYETPVLFPLPQSFIDANTGNPLENNPGY